ncbi:glucosamine-6-phosphate deaminase [Clostridium sp. BNL1100]|uniref:glucosamine-6-phosphate deaminase n=1 Tax=Clostridium sp. BNL1100 TaxID=755731 RepID=UPI00024A7AD4|nr:glucosamine-6-phosphate deaminase [Clostridium sp. BNL1100]AEY67452.1 6-phosphogluconolactonase/glucosamine-6-phosphate isomerase/deaminase [Clostridium sp. BNL1100]
MSNLAEKLVENSIEKNGYNNDLEATLDCVKKITKNNINILVYKSNLEATKDVAKKIAGLMNRKKTDGLNQTANIGLATGKSPLMVYKELVRMHKEEGLDFRDTKLFNLDEFWPVHESDPRSHHSEMYNNLYKHVNINPNYVFIPKGSGFSRILVQQYCDNYEKEINYSGGLDIQLLGIGPNGHIAFNEPGSSEASPTRFVKLSDATLKQKSVDWGSVEKTPKYSITMGIQTIMNANEIALLAFGKDKASVVSKAVNCIPNREFPASLLQKHGNVYFYVDEAAASEI